MAQIGIDIRLWKQTGIGRYIRNLVIGLSNLDHDSQYVLFARPEDIEDIKFLLPAGKAGISNDKFLIIPTDIKWHSISEQIKFPRLLNKYNLDLVHFPYFSVPVLYNKPFVVTVHDLIINHFPTGRASTLPLPLYKLKRMGYEYVLKKAIENAKAIITPTNATREDILNLYKKVSKGKIFVTSEGVDDTISDFKPVLFKAKTPYFLYVGNAYPHKNLEKFLEAFKLFRDNGSPRGSSGQAQFTVKLAGKEDYFYKKLKEYVKKEKIDGVEFLGYVPDEDLAKFYIQAAATFIPSLMEGFGLTALEAMSMGSLVVCSKIPALTEVCGENAVYFHPEDILSINHAMGKVIGLSEKEKMTMVNKAKKHAESFSWKKTAELTLEVYESVLK